MGDGRFLFRCVKACSCFGVVIFLSMSSLRATEILLPSGVSVDLDEKKVSFAITYVGQKSGLEFLVTKGMDKDYEALFSADITGKDLHMALLMVGLEPEKKVEPSQKKDAESVDEDSVTEMTVQKGTPVILEVLFQGQSHPIRRFLEWSDGKPVEDLGLFFLGSRFIKDGDRSIYGADVSLNLVGAWHDSDMVVGPSIEVGSPYQDEGPPFLVPNSKGPIGHLQKARMIIRLKP